MANDHIRITVPGAHRSRSVRYEHDSGLGSSSSERASIGTRSDRRSPHTAANDYGYDTIAKWEDALRSANATRKQLEKNLVSLADELTSAEKARDAAQKELAISRAACQGHLNENETLKEANRELSAMLKKVQAELKVRDRDGKAKGDATGDRFDKTRIAEAAPVPRARRPSGAVPPRFDPYVDAPDYMTTPRTTVRRPSTRYDNYSMPPTSHFPMTSRSAAPPPYPAAAPRHTESGNYVAHALPGRH